MFLEFDQGFHVELHTGAYRGLGGIPSFSCIFRLNTDPYIWIELQIQVDFRKKLHLLCALCFTSPALKRK